MDAITQHSGMRLSGCAASARTVEMEMMGGRTGGVFFPYQSSLGSKICTYTHKRRWEERGRTRRKRWARQGGRIPLFLKVGLFSGVFVWKLGRFPRPNV